MATIHMVPAGTALLSGSVTLINAYEVTAASSAATVGGTAAQLKLVDRTGSSAAAAAGTASLVKTVDQSGESAALAASTALGVAVISVSAPSQAFVYSTARYTGEEMDAWVTFADTGNAGRYTNFAFNSFATIGDRYFAFGEAGVVEIEGTTDLSAPIDLFLLGGTERKDIGLSRPYKSYITGAIPDGLNVFVIDDMDEVYQYPALPSDSRMDTSRVTLGKGIRARHLRNGLFARTTEALELSSVTFYLADSKRNV